jgi:hypothetical protein
MSTTAFPFHFPHTIADFTNCHFHDISCIRKYFLPLDNTQFTRFN